MVSEEKSALNLTKELLCVKSCFYWLASRFALYLWLLTSWL
jgi:hypothetical protein